jgi:hypothetical protein
MYVSMSIHGCTPSCHACKGIPISTAGTTVICLHTPDTCSMRPCPFTHTHPSSHACNRVPIYVQVPLSYALRKAMRSLHCKIPTIATTRTTGECALKECANPNLSWSIATLETMQHMCSSPLPVYVNMRQQGSKTIPLC